LAIDCDDGDRSGNTETATATFQLQPDETVTCVFADCILDLVLSGETVGAPATYEACDTITAASDFTVASDTVFRAANLIVLGDGFSVTGGASFTAEIAPDLQLP
jgi:hypothetical protein